MSKMGAHVIDLMNAGKPVCPQRVKLSRQRGWGMPPNTVVVARPSKWGNPIRVVPAGVTTLGTVTTNAAAVAGYREYLKTREGQFVCEAARRVLRGKNLACWCGLDEPCHANVLLEVANS